MADKDRHEIERLKRRINTARNKLRMQEDAYRDLLERVGNTRSLRAMGLSSLQGVDREMSRLGFKPAPAGPGRRPTSSKPGVRKIYVLWRLLREAGVATAQKPDAWVKRMTGVESPEWLKPGQQQKCIEGLKDWAAREGVKIEEMA